MEYNIILESFEGPMDLLMHLIDKAEINIYDININEITEQYLEYIMKMKKIDLEVTSEFLLMASTLLEIKSKMLLPQREEDSGDQGEVEDIDPRLELVERLIEYKKYKNASKELQKFEEEQSKIHYKPQEDLSYYSKEYKDIEEMDLEQLVNTLNKLLLKNQEIEDYIHMEKILREEYTLEECIKKIETSLIDNNVVEFSDLFDKNSNRIEIIVVFLSLLELIKNKTVTVKQNDNFSDIFIIKQDKGDD